MIKESVVSANNLHIGYPGSKKHGKETLHRDLCFNLFPGELTCLLGVNGAGKSTLLRTIAGLQPPLSGHILLKGKDINRYSEQELSFLLGLVLTDKTSAGGFTVSEMVGLGRYPYTGFFGKLSKNDHYIIDKAIQDVGIGHKSGTYMAELSDGEKQKVMIAKALAQECPIIVLDEPTAFLDIINRIEIMNLLHYLAVSQNKTILLSTHDIELALLMADRLWLLAREKGLTTGATEDIVFSNIINDYLGSNEVAFNIQSGRFSSERKTDKTIFLEAEGDLYYWTNNFLTRNGYQISDNSLLSVRVISPTDIKLKDTNTIQDLHSFEELNLHLKAIHNKSI